MKQEQDQKYSVYVIEENFKAVGVDNWKVVYIGCTIHVQNRWAEHCKPSFAGRTVNDTILAKGVEHFRCIVVGEYDSKELACSVETALMIINKTVEHGYNQLYSVHVPKKKIVTRSVSWTKERRDAQSARMKANMAKRYGKTPDA